MKSIKEIMKITAKLTKVPDITLQSATFVNLMELSVTVISPNSLS